MKMGIVSETVEDVLLYSSGRAAVRIGGGSFTAQVSAMYGNDTSLLTWIGEDLAPAMTSTLAESGVCVQGIISSSRTTKYIMKAQANDKRDTKIYIPKDQKYMLEKIPDEFKQMDVLLLYPLPMDIIISIVSACKHSVSVLAFDPQSTYEDISEIEPLFPYLSYLFLNKQELQGLCGYKEVEHCLSRLRQLYKGNVMVKDGVNGSFIYTDEDELLYALSYEAVPVCPIGAGDCFNVVYLSERMRGADIQTSLDMASYVSAKIIEHEFPDPSFLEREKNIQEWKSGQRKRNARLSPRVYLAAPFFSDLELRWVEFICEQLEQEGLQVFSPSRDAGIINEYTSREERKEIFLRDIIEIENCDIVVALTDNDDQGTLWEIGYAYALGKPVYCLQTSMIKAVNNMISHSSVVVRNVEELKRVIRNNLRGSVWK